MLQREQQDSTVAFLLLYLVLTSKPGQDHGLGAASDSPFRPGNTELRVLPSVSFETHLKFSRYPQMSA